jgi:hypothetical protein
LRQVLGGLDKLDFRLRGLILPVLGQLLQVFSGGAAWRGIGTDGLSSNGGSSVAKRVNRRYLRAQCDRQGG